MVLGVYTKYGIGVSFNFILLIEPFCSTTKTSRQKVKYLDNEKRFWGEIKGIFKRHFIIFKEPSVTKKNHSPKTAPIIILAKFLKSILQPLTGLQFHICHVLKTRLGFEIAEIKIFLNYFSSYSFAL